MFPPGRVFQVPPIEGAGGRKEYHLKRKSKDFQYNKAYKTKVELNSGLADIVLPSEDERYAE